MSAMPKRNAVIDTPDGRMAAILARPGGKGPFGAVIMYPHVGGLTDTMRLMARRCAQGGYLCVAPDLYHRLGTIILDPQSQDENVLAIRRVAAESLTPSSVMTDTRAVLVWLDREPLASRGPKGAIGYGAGGGFAVLAAATYPQEIAAAASVLGFGFTTDKPGSPHLSFPKLRGELYCAFAEHDDIIPPTVPDALAAALRPLPIRTELVRHKGTRHPYAFPDRTVYDKDAAEADWAKIFAMFARQMPAESRAK
ncbi:MAG: dienelactone hydrolase family protein [Hyphomicrobiales bacterium]